MIRMYRGPLTEITVRNHIAGLHQECIALKSNYYIGCKKQGSTLVSGTEPLTDLGSVLSRIEHADFFTCRPVM